MKLEASYLFRRRRELAYTLAFDRALNGDDSVRISEVLIIDDPESHSYYLQRDFACAWNIVFMNPGWSPSKDAISAGVDIEMSDIFSSGLIPNLGISDVPMPDPNVMSDIDLSDIGIAWDGREESWAHVMEQSSGRPEAPAEQSFQSIKLEIILYPAGDSHGDNRGFVSYDTETDPDFARFSDASTKEVLPDTGPLAMIMASGHTHNLPTAIESSPITHAEIPVIYPSTPQRPVRFGGPGFSTTLANSSPQDLSSRIRAAYPSQAYPGFFVAKSSPQRSSNAIASTPAPLQSSPAHFRKPTTPKPSLHHSLSHQARSSLMPTSAVNRSYPQQINTTATPMSVLNNSSPHPASSSIAPAPTISRSSLQRFSNQGTYSPGGALTLSATPSVSDFLQAKPFYAKALPRAETPFGLRRILLQGHINQIAGDRRIAEPPYVTDAEIEQVFGAEDSRSAGLTINATPFNVDIRMLGNIRITAAEIIAFFPNHVLNWPDALYRLVQNGWKTSDIAAYMNYLRGYSGAQVVKTETIRDRMRRNDTKIFGKELGVVHRPKFTTKFFTAKQWEVARMPSTVSGGGLIDYYLVDLPEGLAYWPTGSGARLLTCAIKYAVRHGYRQVKLSDTSDFLQFYQISMPLTPPMAIMGLSGGKHPDVVCKNELGCIIGVEQERQPIGRPGGFPIPH